MAAAPLYTHLGQGPQKSLSLCAPLSNLLAYQCFFLKVLGILKPFCQEGFKRGAGAEPLVLPCPINPNLSIKKRKALPRREGGGYPKDLLQQQVEHQPELGQADHAEDGQTRAVGLADLDGGDEGQGGDEQEGGVDPEGDGGHGGA